VAVTEEARMRLHQRLEEVLGTEQATTLMAHLPPVGWADVATRQHVDHSEAVTRAELRLELAHLRTDLKGEIAELRTELKGEITEVRIGLADLRAEFHRDLRVHTVALATAMVAAVLAAAGLG
jgi:hypothetical protein